MASSDNKSYGQQDLEHASPKTGTDSVSEPAEDQEKIGPSKQHDGWWEHPGIPILLAAIVGGIGPLISAVGEWRAQEAKHKNELQVNASNRRMEYARALMAAPTQEKRLELLALIEASPESDAVDRQWARSEKSRVLNRYAEAEKRIAEAEAKLLRAENDASLAKQAAEEARQRADEHKRRREDAEERASVTETELAILRKREADAAAEVQVAQERKLAALELERKATQESKRVPVEVVSSIGSTAIPGVPSSFLLNDAKDLLAGTGGTISGFVIWAQTPQGGDFWAAEDERVSSGQELSEEARKIITKWVEIAEKAK